MANRSKASGGRFTALLSATTLVALLVSMIAAREVPAQPVDAGEQPPDGPIVYNLIPSEDFVVGRDQLARAGATIETRRDVGVAWAAVFVDGEIRPHHSL